MTVYHYEIFASDVYDMVFDAADRQLCQFHCMWCHKHEYVLILCQVLIILPYHVLHFFIFWFALAGPDDLLQWHIPLPGFAWFYCTNGSSIRWPTTHYGTVQVYARHFGAHFSFSEFASGLRGDSLCGVFHSRDLVRGFLALLQFTHESISSRTNVSHCLSCRNCHKAFHVAR